MHFCILLCGLTCTRSFPVFGFPVNDQDWRDNEFDQKVRVERAGIRRWKPKISQKPPAARTELVDVLRRWSSFFSFLMVRRELSYSQKNDKSALHLERLTFPTIQRNSKIRYPKIEETQEHHVQIASLYCRLMIQLIIDHNRKIEYTLVINNWFISMAQVQQAYNTP